MHTNSPCLALEIPPRPMSFLNAPESGGWLLVGSRCQRTNRHLSAARPERLGYPLVIPVSRRSGPQTAPLSSVVVVHAQRGGIRPGSRPHGEDPILELEHSARKTIKNKPGMLVCLEWRGTICMLSTRHLNRTRRHGPRAILDVHPA